MLYQSEGKTKEEAMYINKSLSFLEQVVLALADRRREHYPFRQSKLTHYLKDSISGNCNTCLIANIWAEAAQIEETVCVISTASYVQFPAPVFGILGAVYWYIVAQEVSPILEYSNSMKT